MEISNYIRGYGFAKALSEVLQKLSQLLIIWVVVFITTVTAASKFTEQSFFQYLNNEVLVISTVDRDSSDNSVH